MPLARSADRSQFAPAETWVRLVSKDPERRVGPSGPGAARSSDRGGNRHELDVVDRGGVAAGRGRAALALPRSSDVRRWRSRRSATRSAIDTTAAMIICAAVVSIALLVALRPWLLRHLRKRVPLEETNAGAHVGRIAVVVAEVSDRDPAHV